MSFLFVWCQPIHHPRILEWRKYLNSLIVFSSESLFFSAETNSLDEERKKIQEICFPSFLIRFSFPLSFPWANENLLHYNRFFWSNEKNFQLILWCFLKRWSMLDQTNVRLCLWYHQMKTFGLLTLWRRSFRTNPVELHSIKKKISRVKGTLQRVKHFLLPMRKSITMSRSRNTSLHLPGWNETLSHPVELIRSLKKHFRMQTFDLKWLTNISLLDTNASHWRSQGESLDYCPILGNLLPSVENCFALLHFFS